jgi:cell division protein FtsB
VAAGLGVPWVLLDPDGTDTPVVIEFGDAQQIVNTPDGIADAVRLALKLPARTENPLLAESFDQLAELVEQHTGTPQRRNVVLSQENEALRRANERLRQRLTVERDKLVEPLAGLWRENADLTGQLAAERAAGAELSRRNEELAAQLADREHQLLAWQNTKLVRWTTPIRRAYGKARGLQR